jgi:hypothetical protein
VEIHTAEPLSPISVGDYLYEVSFPDPLAVLRGHIWGKPNTRVTGRKVSGCREGDWAGVDFAETTKGAPEAIIGSAIGRLPHRKWLDFGSIGPAFPQAYDFWHYWVFN